MSLRKDINETLENSVSKADNHYLSNNELLYPIYY